MVFIKVQHTCLFTSFHPGPGALVNLASVFLCHLHTLSVWPYFCHTCSYTCVCSTILLICSIYQKFAKADLNAWNVFKDNVCFPSFQQMRRLCLGEDLFLWDFIWLTVIEAIRYLKWCRYLTGPYPTDSHLPVPTESKLDTSSPSICHRVFRGVKTRCTGFRCRTRSWSEPHIFVPSASSGVILFLLHTPVRTGRTWTNDWARLHQASFLSHNVTMCSNVLLISMSSITEEYHVAR